MTALTWFRSLARMNQILLGMGGVIFALTLHVLGVAGLSSLQATTVLFAIAFILRLRQNQVIPHPHPTPPHFLLSGIWILFLSLNQTSLAAQNWLIYLLPLTTAIGLSLLLCGRTQWGKYYQNLALFLILTIPIERLIHPLNNLFGVSHFMAKLSTFFLWYVGFNVNYHEDFIVFPQRAMWIDPHCAGIATILWMLQLAILFLILIPTRKLYKVIVPLVAISTVLLVNGIRLGMLAFFAAHSPTAFDFWHSDNSQIFSTLPIFLFGIFCWFVVQDKTHQVNPQEKFASKFPPLTKGS
ncbi:archaeosortase/exosortase family protein [Spirulina subsalsa FACHB-351]|uniref:Archaeosortase/exosortase family protein n=1 Tax=Spirulina subsalsa FACHB-351 TaxID=234711 RepID=A0ABT3L793_9CYAN|nr:archaeosortase/exosortase family protein [Spirulina subsalsa]MCW6037376.1 archaeosortase/exosortase family protein [Spirulina subsalsa FACHB-351]